MENTIEEHRRKQASEEAHEPSLEEVYEKWQSQPTTTELWGEMSEEIQRAMEKRAKKLWHTRRRTVFGRSIRKMTKPTNHHRTMGGKGYGKRAKKLWHTRRR